MGLFSIDIERFYDELEEKDQQLKGIFCIQYPIYCIHANIIDITQDPLDNFDKAIVNFFIAKSDFTPLQIAGLMGTSKSLIEQRITKLLLDGLIENENNVYTLSVEGVEVFKDKVKVRQHVYSYDFFLDGVTLDPLPKIYYDYYSSKFISENDSYYHTNYKGETYIVRPFGPDLVHTPPNKAEILNKVFNVESSIRSSFAIPNGLLEINDISFTKQTIQLLVSVSSNKNGLIKEVIDGFAIYSLSDNISYYDALRRYIIPFEKNIKDKIENLEFKIDISPSKVDEKELPKPIITSNWPEIDKFKTSQNKCFSFSTTDLLNVIEHKKLFNIYPVKDDLLVNDSSNIKLLITKEMLLNSYDRNKLLNDLIRERDYRLGNPDKNVFLLFLYYITNDEFVKDTIQFKKEIQIAKKGSINIIEFIQNHPSYNQNLRHHLILAGEYELLEKYDIANNMII